MRELSFAICDSNNCQTLGLHRRNTQGESHSLLGGTGRSRLSRAVRVRIGDTERNHLTKLPEKQPSTLTSTDSRYRSCLLSTGFLRRCNRARTIIPANCSWVVGVLRPHAGGGCGTFSQATESCGPVLARHRRLGLTSESWYVIRHPDAKAVLHLRALAHRMRTRRILDSLPAPPCGVMLSTRPFEYVCVDRLHIVSHSDHHQAHCARPAHHGLISQMALWHLLKTSLRHADRPVGAPVP